MKGTTKRSKHRRRSARTSYFAAVFAGMSLWTSDAQAVRPFVTDDAESVDEGILELQTYAQAGDGYVDHAVELALGLTPWLELATGFEHTMLDGRYGLVGPLFQAKVSQGPLPLQGGTFGAAAGGRAPFGLEALSNEGWTGYLVGIYSHSLADGAWILHANVGVATEERVSEWFWSPTLAVGALHSLSAKVNAIAEVFYSDPLDLGFELGGQIGVQYVFNDQMQMDVAAGGELEDFSALRPWVTVGFRVLLDAF